MATEDTAAAREAHATTELVELQAREINRLCGLLAQAQAERDAARAALAAQLGLVTHREPPLFCTSLPPPEPPATRARHRPPPLDLGPVADPWPAEGHKG